MDVVIDNLTIDEVRRIAEQYLSSHRFHHIVTPGPEFLLESSANPEFKRILSHSDLSLADGVGLNFAALMSQQRFPHRITGVDFTEELLKITAFRHARIFLFGGKTGVAEKAAIEIKSQHPGVVMAGYESGFRGPWQKMYDTQLIRKIHIARPDILLVGLGAPKQELWIDQHRRDLHRVGIVMGVGRTLDYIARVITRPPAAWRRSGFEWLYTYLHANQFNQQIGHQSAIRRQRVKNATLHFMIEVIKHTNAKPHRNSR